MKINLYDTRMEDLKTILVKEKEITYGNDEIEIHYPKQIVSLMNEVFELNRLAEEHCYMLATNTRGFLLGVFFISKGTATVSNVGMRELFIRALLSGAVSILLCHNHPSSEVIPSREDIALTKRIKECGELLGIPLLDHVIIGGDGYFSFQEYGML